MIEGKILYQNQQEEDNTIRTGQNLLCGRLFVPLGMILFFPHDTL